MKSTAYVTHGDCSRHDTGWGHPEHQGRLRGVTRAVYRDMLALFDPLLEVEAVPATAEDLHLVHTPEYVERVRRAAADAERQGRVITLEGEVRASGASWEAATAAVGAALTAVDLVLRGEVRNAFCAVRPPGQGAGVGRPGGFSLVNTAAVAAMHLRKRRGIERVLVVEFGAAAGRGTVEIVGAEPGVRLVTVHEERGSAVAAPSVVSRPVPAGAGADVVRRELDTGIRSATVGFDPEFVILSAGFDLLDSDPVGGLRVFPADVHGLTTRLRILADDLCGGRLVSVLEGGYDPVATGLAVVQHLRALADLPPA